MGSGLPTALHGQAPGSGVRVRHPFRKYLGPENPLLAFPLSPSSPRPHNSVAAAAMIASTAIGRVEEVQLLKPVLPSLVKAIISVVGQQIRQMQRQLSPAADMPLHWPTAEMCQQRSSRLHAL
jgi:hypothetical protein